MTVNKNNKISTNNKNSKNNINSKNIGIMDRAGTKINPMNGQKFSEKWLSSPKWWQNLPMYADSNKIINLINDNQVLLVISGTGSGKTVLVPFYALHTLNYQGRVVMTIPKTGVVLKAATTSSEMADVVLGKEVGYQYRGSRLSNGGPTKSESTKLLISTDGSIVAQLINDPEMKAYDIVIIDEAHERGVQIDLLLLLMKKALRLNKKLKLIVMSATINPLIFENYFKSEFKYAAVNVSGNLTNYPVKMEYLQKPLANPEKDFIKAGISRIIQILE